VKKIPDDPSGFWVRTFTPFFLHVRKNGRYKKLTWDVQSTWFLTLGEAKASIAGTGCDCCHRVPRRVKPNVRYKVGYSNEVVIIPVDPTFGAKP
jgi:hypothetical protein